ncbi:response regulator transcription factor [Portibacter marinus]|uniref:response regulator transcription factor n=1 Tax=Portibacter marinus TaxID=2898660 RepID=UPI001F2C68E6|nr:response regulator transcription factor [Portibacter marinus]
MSNTKVLIVEDEALIAMDLEMIMESMGHHVVGITGNGDEALDMIANRQPDLILLDVNIQGQKDGIELAEIIKDRSKKPFIFITSYADKSTLDRAKHTLPYGYILKPFSEQELKATVEIALFRYANESTDEVPSLNTINQNLMSEITDKEYEVMVDIYNGLANQQIASKHFISVNTVKTHVKKLYAKADVHNRAELVKWLSTQ